VRATAKGAEQARTLVGEARQDAEHSGQVVGRAVQAMDSIEQSARQIGQIIGVIDEIAFQTNLLALNAGVEAARAGDAAVNQMDQVVQRNAAMVEESTAAAASLKTETAQLVELMGRFKTGAVAAAVEPEPTARRARPALRPLQSNRRTSAALASRLSMEESTEGWEEF
jgi:methyl-accepting chemotaxis protein